MKPNLYIVMHKGKNYKGDSEGNVVDFTPLSAYDIERLLDMDDSVLRRFIMNDSDKEKLK